MLSYMCRRLSLPGRLGSLSPIKSLVLKPRETRKDDNQEDDRDLTPGADMEDVVSSMCSTPTMMEALPRQKVGRSGTSPSKQPKT